MNADQENTGARPGATVAQLKDDIDSGRTGDKVGGLDLAAAPLGTDDEAAGTPPSPELIAHAREAERGIDSARANAASPEITPNGAVGRSSAKPVIVGVLIVAAIIAITAALVM